MRATAGSAWIPSYPPLEEAENLIVDVNSNSGSLEDVRHFWNKTAESYEEKVFRGNSPLKLLKSRDQLSGDLGATTAAVPANPPSELDGVPITEGHTYSIIKQTGPSPPKPLLCRPPLAGTPNKWRENLKSPPDVSGTAAVLTPARGPLEPQDTGATIPILPSNANQHWPPRSPNQEYQTPRPALVPKPFGSVPPSSFVPRYTPAPGPMEIVTESLVSLQTPPNAEDQYEMTEWENSDGEADEDEVDRVRRSKRIPAWCIGWIDTAKTQTSIDPDTVFGMKLPKCDLEVLFGHTNNAYLKARRGKRGSSGEWGMDDVTRRELDEYRQIMGHTQQLESVVIVRTVEHLP